MKYVIDLDGVIFNTDIAYHIITANFTIIDKINKLYEEGNTIIIHTGRHWDKLDFTKNDLEIYGVKYDTLVMGKPTGDFYVDDKAVRPDEFEC